MIPYCWVISPVYHQPTSWLSHHLPAAPGYVLLKSKASKISANSSQLNLGGIHAKYIWNSP